uniref:Uncharacterized protein n=1 Tax=viral metagenome TaxID=1070528 RepID=A0A6H1ZV36_9ZZZZ
MKIKVITGSIEIEGCLQAFDIPNFGLVNEVDWQERSDFSFRRKEIPEEILNAYAGGAINAKMTAFCAVNKWSPEQVKAMQGGIF